MPSSWLKASLGCDGDEGVEIEGGEGIARQKKEQIG
jgi:hypothetical protein